MSLFKKISFSISFASAVLLTGCADELKKKEEPSDPRVVQLQANQLTIKVKGLNQPNTYDIEIEWPEARGQVRVSGNTKMLGIVSGNDKKFLDSSIKGGSEISYLVEHVSEDGRITASIPVFVRVPQDVVWDSELELKEHLKVTGERLFITNRALIYIYDKNLSISVREIIAEGGTIQNFKDDTQAALERNGRSGGTITINAKKASGSLQVNLSGEHGGNGKNGVNYHLGTHPGCAGTSGGNGGNAGNLNINILDGTSLNISTWNKEGKKGVAGQRGSVSDGPRDQVVYPPCDRNTANGVDGEPGIRGQICLKMSEAADYVCQ